MRMQFVQNGFLLQLVLLLRGYCYIGLEGILLNSVGDRSMIASSLPLAPDPPSFLLLLSHDFFLISLFCYMNGKRFSFGSLFGSCCCRYFDWMRFIGDVKSICFARVCIE